ncbi:unnamed protein product [Amoebophrya sp. A120]|nr:unnamed protein product [Amoebophrya sp. A120]|eukprot:GSA120T00002470001.1
MADFGSTLSNGNSLDAAKIEALPDCKGKGVLITGCSGIGGALATLCCLKEAEKVFVVDRAQKALDGVKDHPNLVKILADIGTKDGPKSIADAVGSAKIHYVLLGAAAPKNTSGTGHNLKSISREDFDDMMNTDVHGKLFVMQALANNLGSEPKARVFNLGAPFSDGPKPDGTYMVVPGWGGFGAVKAANKWLHEGMKVDMKEQAIFGYGHPGMTKSLLTDEFAENYDKNHPMAAMVSKRWAAGDYHTPEETAAIFYSVFSKTSDDDFQTGTWSIVRSWKEFGKDLGCKEIMDVNGGIPLPAPEK